VPLTTPRCDHRANPRIGLRHPGHSSAPYVVVVDFMVAASFVGGLVGPSRADRGTTDASA